MQEMKCPRCGGPIPIAEGTVRVRCPSCFEEFRVSRRSPMSEAVARFREQSGGQPSPAGPTSAKPAPPRPSSAPPPVPPTPQAPAGPIPLKSPAPPVAQPAPTPQVATAAPNAYPLPPRRRVNPLAARQQQRMVWGVVAVALLVVCAIGTIGAMIYYNRTGGFVFVDVRTPAPKNTQGKIEDEEDEEDEPDADRPTRGGYTAPTPGPGPTRTSEEPSPEPPARPPGSGQYNLEVVWGGKIQVNEHDDTYGWIGGQVNSREGRAILSANVIAHFFTTDEQEYPEPFRVNMIPAGGGVRFGVNLEGVPISRLALDKTVFEVLGVQPAAEDAVVVEVVQKALPAETELMETRKVTGRVRNSTGGPVFDVYVAADVYDRSGQLLAQGVEMVKLGVTIPADGGEDFEVELLGATIVTDNPELEVRALGRQSR